MRVDRQVVLRAGHPPVLAPPKTDASFRTIPLPAGVAAVLRSHLAAFPATTRPEHGALVFTTPAGEPLRRNRFGDVWRAAVRRSGARRDLTFHDLRHYYASLLIRHRESVKVVQRRLGHQTAKETLDTYGHLWPDSDDRTRGAVDAELFRAGGPAVAAGDSNGRQGPAGDRPAGELPRPGRGLAVSAADKAAGERVY
ncbi:MAG: site-specific integrase [Actinomycetota bacterium]|nr:site-specific integrase [Actinomycetota bacterium]